MEKKFYRIPCTWQEYGVMEIEATSLEEAVEIAESESRLPDGSYVEASFEVNHEMLEFFNGEDTI